MNTSSSITNIYDAVKFLVEKSCWAVAAGEGSGSVISLDFGEKIKRNKPLLNEYLTEDQRRFQREYDLFVEYAKLFLAKRS